VCVGVTTHVICHCPLVQLDLVKKKVCVW